MVVILNILKFFKKMYRFSMTVNTVTEIIPQSFCCTGNFLLIINFRLTADCFQGIVQKVRVDLCLQNGQINLLLN